MTSQMINATVEILGKAYTIRCPESETHSLQQAANYLNKAMQELSDPGKVLGVEKIIIITALNITHKFLALENEHKKTNSSLHERIGGLFNMIELALNKKPHMELVSSE